MQPRKTKQHKQAYKNSLLLKELVKQTDNVNLPTDELKTAQISKSGNYIIQYDGANFVSDSKLEVTLPNNADLSINQKGGFTLFFWILLRKSSSGVHRYIFKKGNTSEEITPSLGILPNGQTMFVKILTSKNRVESLFSSKKIDTDRLYNIAATFEIDYNNDLTDIALFIDGLLDSQITVPGEPLHNQGNVLIGKFNNLNYGFNGWIADIMLIPLVLHDADILEIGNISLQNIHSCKALRSYMAIEQKLENKILIKKYAELTGIPLQLINSMNFVNDDFREIMKYYKVEHDSQLDYSHLPKIEENIKLNNLKEFLGQELSQRCISLKTFYTYLQLLYTTIFLSAGEEAEDIEIIRIINILEIFEEALNIKLTQNEFADLFKILNCFVAPGSVKFLKFFNEFQECMSIIYPNHDVAIYVGDDKNQLSPVGLHENLLLSTQNFKVLDLDFQKDLCKNSFTIKSFYNRTKSGKTMNKIEDAVNQQYDDCNRMKDDEVILEKENENEKNVSQYYEAEKRNDETNKMVEPSSHQEALNDHAISKDNQSHKSIHEEQKNADQSHLLAQEQPHAISEDIVNKENQFSNNQETDIKKDSIVENNNKFEIETHSVLKKTDTPQELNEASLNYGLTNEQGLNQNSTLKGKENKLEPKFSDDWNKGGFELIINRCYNCHLHKTTTKHLEVQFIDKFNEIGEEIKNEFPNIKIIGNYDTIDYYGCFDIYVRGVGPRQDNHGRCFLYKIKDKKRFPTCTEITDKLKALSILYRSSVNLEICQASFLKNYKGAFKPSNFCHEHPVDPSQEASQHKEKVEEIENFKKLKVQYILNLFFRGKKNLRELNMSVVIGDVQEEFLLKQKIMIEHALIILGYFNLGLIM